MKRQVFAIIVLSASVALNVALAYRLRQLNRLFGITKVDVLQSGTVVPPFSATDIDGHMHTITYSDVSTPTVLYVLTPTCSWCARNMDDFRALSSTASTEYRFIGLSLAEDGLAQYVAKYDLRVPIYSRLSQGTLKAYKLGSTPQTIVISPSGRVLRNWMGAYTGEQQSQIEQFFRLKLPGLHELPPATYKR
jgi:peroxiredoxin